MYVSSKCNEYAESCFLNWLFEFVQIYHRVSPTNAQERFPPRKEVRMVKIRELFTVFMWTQESVVAKVFLC